MTDLETELAPASTAVGRDREQAVIASLIDHACAGSGGALILRGEPGIGKTMLLAAARRLGADRDLRILSCSGVPAESNLPFAGLHQMLRPVLGAISKVSAHQARLLRATFGSEESLQSDIYRVALATLELLTAAAADTPLLVAADDAHWIDRPSTDVLAFVGRRIAAEPIAMLVAVRDGTDDPFAGRDLPKLALAPLDNAASAALLDRVAPDLPHDFRAGVLSSAAGNPLALIELPPQAHRWGPSPDRIAVGELLESSYATRTAALPRATRTLLLVAAADPSCSVAELCAAASQVHGQRIAPADVQPAIDARLANVVTEQVVFCHPLMASAIYQSAELADRLGTHTALANVIGDDDRRVWHRAAASLGPDDDVAAQLEVVSERALRRGAISVSITALDRMAVLTSDRTRRADVLLRASERAVEIGRRGLAINLAARADPDQLSALGKARMMIVDDGVWAWRTDDALTVAALVRATRGAREAGDPSLAASVLWTAAKRCYWTSASIDDRVEVDVALTELGLAADDARRIAISAYTGLSRHRGSLERELARADISTDDVFVLRYLGSAAMNLGDHVMAVPLLAGAITAARKQGKLGEIPRLQALQAWAALWSGSLDAVTVAAGEAERLGLELDQPMWHGAAVLEHALVTAFRGDYAAGKEQMRIGLLDEDVRGVRLFHAMALFGLGVAALGVGEYQEAYDNLRRLVDDTDSASHYGARQWVSGTLVEAALRTGRLDECTDLLDALREDGTTDPPSAVRRGTRYAQALLAPDSTAEETYARALADPASPGLALGRTKLAYGSWLRRQRRPREARAVLGEARDVFDRLGMTGFAHRAGSELRAAGGIDTRQHGDGIVGVTPQELQIAQLAATGLSNRQIAEQLFLSHRTVSSHLYHVYPKLGITARGELAEALAATRR